MANGGHEGLGRIGSILAAIGIVASGGAAVLRPLEQRLAHVQAVVERLEARLREHENLLMHKGARILHDQASEKFSSLEKRTEHLGLETVSLDSLRRTVEKLEGRVDVATRRE